jgi:hypothetical protein
VRATAKDERKTDQRVESDEGKKMRLAKKRPRTQKGEIGWNKKGKR